MLRRSMKPLTFCIVFVVSLFMLPNPATSDRYIYNIAHMVNSLHQIDEWLGYGANAIEADVTFRDDGTPEYLYHGVPCDAFRFCNRWSYIKNYVEAIRQRILPSSSKFNSNLVLFMFDLKMTKLEKNVLWQAGVKFADTVLIPLYSNNPTKMKVMLSIADFTLKDFIRGILARLKVRQPTTVSKIGFELNSEKEVDDPKHQEQAFKKIGVEPGHAWLSEGTSNWFFIFRQRKIAKELKSLNQYRDNDEDDYFSKTYTWTVDQRSTARSLLETGIDGIISNYPAHVNKAIKDINEKRKADGFGEKLRLATLEDDPFKRVENIKH